MRILVAGADGFLGSHLVDELARHDVEVVPLAAGIAPVRAVAGEMPAADCTRLEQVAPYLAGVTHVINAIRLTAPGLREGQYDAANVTTATTLLDAALDAEIEGFVHFSSTLPYGDALPGWPVDESRAFRPRTARDHSLVLAERAVRTYRRRLPLVVLRPGLLFGPRDTGPMQSLLAYFRRPGRIILPGAGRAPVSLAYGPDVARAAWDTLAHLGATADSIYHVKTIDTDWSAACLVTREFAGARGRVIALPPRLVEGLARLPAVPPPLRLPVRLDAYARLVGRPALLTDARFRVATGFAPLFGLRAAIRKTLEAVGGGPGVA